jgi:protein LTV1
VLQVEQDYERDDEDDDEEDAPYLEDMDEDMISNYSTASRASRLFTGRKRDADSNDPPEISREDFDNILDDFLDNYEVVGNRMVPVLTGETGAEKLETLRKALVGLDVDDTNAEASSSKVGGSMEDAEYIRKRYLRDDIYDDDDDNDDDAEQVWPAPPKPKDKWDAETILSTYSNLENHPRMIGSRSSKARKQKPQSLVVEEEHEDEDEDNSGSETEMEDEHGRRGCTLFASRRGDRG